MSFLTAKFALASSNLTLNLSALTAPLKMQAGFVGLPNLSTKAARAVNLSQI